MPTDSSEFRRLLIRKWLDQQSKPAVEAAPRPWVPMNALAAALLSASDPHAQAVADKVLGRDERSRKLADSIMGRDERSRALREKIIPQHVPANPSPRAHERRASRPAATFSRAAIQRQAHESKALVAVAQMPQSLAVIEDLLAEMVDRDRQAEAREARADKRAQASEARERTMLKVTVLSLGATAASLCLTAVTVLVPVFA